MRNRVLIGCLFLLAVCIPVASQDDAGLTQSDKALLEKVGTLVVKPTPECVRFKAMNYWCWGGGGEVERLAWLVRDANNKPERVLDIDGEWMELPAEYETVDFLALCKEDYGEGSEEDDTFEDMRQTSLGPAGAWPDLVVAYWCHELGDSELAATVMSKADRGASDDETINRLKADLAWRSFAGSAHAFINGDDKQALHFVERFEQKYKGFDDEFGTPASDILAELTRRKEAGTFGEYSATEYDDDWNPIVRYPEGWDEWDDTGKLDWLLEQLENVDARQWSQPGGVDLGSDWRVKEIIELGDTAVSKLIDCIESDTRLTRSMHFWRDFATHRTVLATREPALVAIMTILQVEVFEPVATGDNFSSRGEEGAIEVAAKLRKYWKEYGKYPFDERMMKILTNPEARLEARQEAALNLAYINDRAARGTTVWSSGARTRSEEPNPVVEKFTDPTTAEAIVNLMDEHVAQIAVDEADDGQMMRYYISQAVWSYVDALVELNDKRILQELKSRIDGETETRVKHGLAWACLQLNDEAPLQELCRRFIEGTEPGLADEETLADLIRMFTSAEMPEADAALNAMLKPDHPAHEVYRDKVLNEDPEWSDDAVWFRTKACITLLREQLDIEDPSGRYYEIKEGQYTERYNGGSTSGAVPDWMLADSDLARHAAGRYCDDAAIKLNELVGGLPRYNPLLSDADERLATMRKRLDHYDANVRIADDFELEAMGEYLWGPLFMISPPPLDRAANGQDVKEGKALFHLPGGERAALKLPAMGAFGELPEPDNDEPVHDEREWCLIFQAEMDASGKTWFAVVERYNIRKIAADELHDVTAYEE